MSLEDASLLVGGLLGTDDSLWHEFNCSGVVDSAIGVGWGDTAGLT
jgi:hypothetical protein